MEINFIITIDHENFLTGNAQISQYWRVAESWYSQWWCCVWWHHHLLVRELRLYMVDLYMYMHIHCSACTHVTCTLCVCLEIYDLCKWRHWSSAIFYRLSNLVPLQIKRSVNCFFSVAREHWGLFHVFVWNI